MRRVGFGISSRGVTRSNYLLIAEFDPGWGHPPRALCGLMRGVLDLTSPAGGTHLRRILEGKIQGNAGWGSACGTEHRVQMLGRGAQRCVEVCVRNATRWALGFGAPASDADCGTQSRRHVGHALGKVHGGHRKS